MINCFCNLNQMCSSLFVYANFIKFGYEVDVVTMNPLIKGFFLEGKVDEAAECFHKMIKAGCSLMCSLIT